MNLPRSGLAEHTHQGALGVAADDGVVDHHEPLARYDLLERVQLQADAELADGLAGLDEGAAHVGVLDQAEAEWDAGGLRVADGGWSPGVGGGDDQVRVDGVFASQDPADLHAGGVDAAACDGGVGPGQVDIFEEAALGLGVGESLAAQPGAVDGDELAGLDLTHETGADDVKGGGLRSDHPATGEPP